MFVARMAKSIDKPIDFEGQRLCRALTHLVLLVGCASAVITGFVMADLKYSAYVGIGTIVAGAVLSLPSWPFYRMNPVNFTKEKDED